MLTDITHKLFTLQKLKGIGPSTLDKLAKLPDFASASIDSMSELNPKLAKVLKSPGAWEGAKQAVDRDIKDAMTSGTEIICVLDDEYPALLRSAPDHPFFLYVRGRFHQNPSRAIAIVGTRYPTEHGKIITERITQFFIRDGWSIISGLALGCDAIAHQIALSEGGHTVAVMAHGLHTIAPKQHERLANKILESGGALVSEYGFGVEPFPHQFVKRDRIQAGLSRGVVMIQSDLEGGSLHASRATIEYQRILAIPIPTERDITNRERKVEGNRVLTNDTDKNKCLLLKCNESDLRRLFVLRSKEDYPRLSQILLNV